MSEKDQNIDCINFKGFSNRYPTIFVKNPLVLSFILSVLIFTLIQLDTARAQTNQLKKGDRVRITAPIVQSKKITGTVREIDESVLVLAVEDSSFYISESLIQRMESFTGQRRLIEEGFFVGAFVGTLGLGLISVFTNNACGFAEDCNVPNRNGNAFLAGAATGLVLGSVAGAITGYFIKINEWERVPVRVAMGLTSVSPSSSFPSQPNQWAVEPMISFRISLD